MIKTRINENGDLGYGYLLKWYVGIFLIALRRTSTREDLLSLIFMLLAPLLYLMGFKGKIRTPVGYVVIANRGILRSFVYGFFKTHFAYMYGLRELSLERSFFSLIVDVGANIGDFTLAMIKRAGKIVAVEPAEENFMALCANLQINHVNNVVPIRVAAHNRQEEVFLQGASSDMYVTQEKKGQLVKGMPLDLIIRELGIQKIDILKIDVQGHERSVLIGAQNLLEDKFVKLLIVEVHLKRGVSVGDIVSLMKAHGYSLIYKDAYQRLQPKLYFEPKYFQSKK